MGKFISFIRSLKHLDVLKVFEIEVENLLSKRIKCVRFAHGGKYYGKYNRLVNDI